MCELCGHSRNMHLFHISDDHDSFEDLTAKFHPSYRDNTMDGYEEVSELVTYFMHTTMHEFSVADCIAFTFST